MTVAEYGSMESQAMAALQQLREKGVNGDNIGILMSREIYDLARAGGNSAYAVSVENFRAVYWGMMSMLSPRSLRQYSVQSSQGSQTTLTYSNSMQGHFLPQSRTMERFVSIRSQRRNTHFFCETEFTVRQAHQMERVTFADRIRAGQEQERQQRDVYMPHDWSDWMSYTTLRADFLASQPTWRELERQFDEIATTMQRGTGNTTPKKKKAPPQKDWDERITPEDTKELDEFLNSLARKGTLESAT